ncbi:hypothetical protein SKTS_13510 [Sulfurimicrobium lacus]|uniref:Terminase large subunit gp17-like C-terminal domain-containing protein n=1 Tax=Sulfurimicrobium lacus TaxID=2715678 RepID=A0A6F8VCH9_9PROT|nr:hypothetical protein [Sulfurimicrobium lacus]BCB26465.1 hypothetical protein SKTS_13510 [Sulfurimicrobium lacus]
MASSKPTTEKDFLKEIANISQEVRAEIEAHQIGLDPSPAARAERRRRVLKDGDFEFFCYTYFPHHIRPPASQFHRHFFKRFPQILDKPSGAKEWWVAPRGEAKSSLTTKVGPCWVAVRALLQKPAIRAEVGWEGETPYFIDYITMLGAETKLPTKLLEVVKVELTVNAALALDFPEACGPTKNWKIGDFTTKSGVKVESFGAEQAIRGTFHGASRPKLLLGDDLITDKEAKSPTECNNRWDWLEKAVDFLGPPEGNVKFVGVGTVLNKNDPISRAKGAIGHLVHHFRALITLPARMDMWEECQAVMLNQDKPAEEEASERGEVLEESGLPSYIFYQAHRAEMEEGAEISWPGVRSLFWLMRQRAKNARAFATEMQGDPRSDEDKIFAPVRFFVSRLPHWIMLGGCDPSMGKGEKSHPSALVAGAYDHERGRLHVIEARIKRRVPSKLEADLIQFQRDFHCLAIGFENNNAYEHSRQTFITAGLAKGVALPLVGLTETVDREVRIDGMEPYITDAYDPRILFSPELTQLLSELDSWPEKQTSHDYDGLCALYILWKLCVVRGITGSGFQSLPRHPSGSRDDDDYGNPSRRMF